MTTETIGPVHPWVRELAQYDNLDQCYLDNHNRERLREDGEDWLIDGLVPMGAMLVYADPGVGKSYLVQQIVHTLAYGRPLGPWGADTPGGHLVRIWNLESDWRLDQDRGYAITPYGALPQDGEADRDDNYVLTSTAVIPPADREAWGVITSQADRNSLYLEQVLTEAAAAGQPIRCVVIDTLAKFAGPRPQQTNAYEHEAAVLDRLNRLGLDHRCAVILIHHTNKAGEISGSTGLAGSATVSAKLEVEAQTDEDRDQGVPPRGTLKSTKVRHGRPFHYSMEQTPEGPWAFIDRPPSETEASGQARVVLASLAAGPLTRRELVAATGIESGSIDQVLARMRRDRRVVSRYGRWHLTVDPDRPRTLPGQPDGTCSVCGGPMTIVEDGQATHPGCVPEPEPEDEDPDAWSPIASVAACLDLSRMHPVRYIRKHLRDQEPWSLITEQMTGEHRWVTATEYHDDASVVVLDRRGSYPSACSSVELVPGLLEHSGALDGPEKARGGLFRIERVSWEHGPHPLGWIAEEDSDTWWITTPHLRRLYQIGAEPRIVDSWTGRSTSGLLAGFSRDVQERRIAALEAIEQGAGEEEYVEVKRKASVALRSLWFKSSEAKSPFWRPDWSVTIRAEAAARHWWQARQAERRGATLLSLGRVDEVALLSDGVPAPYALGDSYGKVSVKAQTSFGEWRSHRGNRAR